MLEVHHLPMLLAGNVFAKPGDWTGARHRRYLRLSADQSALIWSAWRDDEGADESEERSALISRLMCVSMSKGSRTMVLQVGESEKLTFEGRAETIAAWSAALSRLIATVKQRRTYETLYGGLGQAPFSPRTRAVQNPRVRALLSQRQAALMETQ